MPLAKVDDIDEDWDYSGLEYDSNKPGVVSADPDSDSDEEFQEDFMHRAILHCGADVHASKSRRYICAACIPLAECRHSVHNAGEGFLWYSTYALLYYMYTFSDLDMHNSVYVYVCTAV